MQQELEYLRGMTIHKARKRNLRHWKAFLTHHRRRSMPQDVTV